MSDKKNKLDEKIEQIDNQLKQTEALYMKLQGAKEVLLSMKDEEKDSKSEKK